jgi:1,4-alpha-glucan branching enzyme
MVKKAYTKTGRSCRVTFRLPDKIHAQKVALCGEFNDWDATAHPMKKRKDGGFSLTISLKPGRSYRYRFLLDDERWENDWDAEAYEANPYGGEDSIIHV